MLLTNSTNSGSSRSLQDVLLEQGQRVVLSPFVLTSLYETHRVLRANAVGRDGFLSCTWPSDVAGLHVLSCFLLTCVSLLRGLPTIYYRLIEYCACVL